MFSRQQVALVRAGWGTVVSCAAVLLFASAGLAQESQAGDRGNNANRASTTKTKTEQKNSTELEKARADVKALHEQMDKLREQMHTTAEKMHKAYANLAKLEGHHAPWWAHSSGWGDHGWGHGMAMAGWDRMRAAMMAHGPHHWAGFQHAGFWGHEGANASVDQRLNHLQSEIDQLRRQLKQSPPAQR